MKKILSKRLTALLLIGATTFTCGFTNKSNTYSSSNSNTIINSEEANVFLEDFYTDQKIIVDKIINDDFNLVEIIEGTFGDLIDSKGNKLEVVVNQNYMQDSDSKHIVKQSINYRSKEKNNFDDDLLFKSVSDITDKVFSDKANIEKYGDEIKNTVSAFNKGDKYEKSVLESKLFLLFKSYILPEDKTLAIESRLNDLDGKINDAPILYKSMKEVLANINRVNFQYTLQSKKHKDTTVSFLEDRKTKTNKHIYKEIEISNKNGILDPQTIKDMTKYISDVTGINGENLEKDVSTTLDSKENKEFSTYSISYSKSNGVSLTIFKKQLN